MNEDNSWLLVAAIIIGVWLFRSEAAAPSSTEYFCLGKCKTFATSDLIMRTFTVARDNTHVWEHMTDIAFGPDGKPVRSDSDEYLSDCIVYDGNNWTCHKSLGSDIDWDFEFRDGALMRPGYLVTGSAIWSAQYYLADWAYDAMDWLGLSSQAKQQP